jgi:hypothetical protein
MLVLVYGMFTRTSTKKGLSKSLLATRVYTVWQVSPPKILANDVVYIVHKRQDMSFCDVMSEYNLVLQACVSQ